MKARVLLLLLSLSFSLITGDPLDIHSQSMVSPGATGLFWHIQNQVPPQLRLDEESQIPYVVWDKVPNSSSYRIIIQKESDASWEYRHVDQERIRIIPGQRLKYRVLPLDAKGEPRMELLSEPLNIFYTARVAQGGMTQWIRPDGYLTYRGAESFPRGMYWSRSLANEIKDWITTTYGTEYLLGGHIAERDPIQGEWIAPLSPLSRRTATATGYGLDCVGFANGFYYLYSMAFAGQDYQVMDRSMTDTYRVYGTEFTPSGYSAFLPNVVIKPSLKGTYADPNHIRAGDINESHDHVWIVSHEGKGMKSKIWEYEYEGGFSDHRELSDLQNETKHHPYDYWISGIVHPMESYSSIMISAENEKGQAVTGGVYQLTDSFGRVLAMEELEGIYQLYRPEGEHFFEHLIDPEGETEEFYDETSSFLLKRGGARLERVIVGKYFLKEISTPPGYEPSLPIEVKLDPGEERSILIKYKKVSPMEAKNEVIEHGVHIKEKDSH